MSFLALLVLAGSGTTARRSGAHGAPQETGKSYDPEAARILSEMTEAYTHLSALRQETEFSSEIMPLTPIPIPPETQPGDEPGIESEGAARRRKGMLTSERKLDRKLRLAFAAPNRLNFEVVDTDEAGKVKVSRWVCDGKTFWTYSGEKNLFSREKAPGKIRDFARLAHMTSGSLEVLMLMGVNPFAKVQEDADSLRYLGRETVLGAVTDVVRMTADLGLQSNETRLYIGVDDRLLHRLVSETSQKPKAQKPAGSGGPLDELATPDPATAPPLLNPGDLPPLPGVLMKSRVTGDNRIETSPKFDFDSFTFQAPADAYFLTNPDPKKPPMTLKQRIAELNKSARRQKRSAPKVYRY